jgi:carbon monoxide dehydrogenase subunit G
MTRFTGTTNSAGIVTTSRDKVWELLTDPDAVARLTPFVKSIEADGDLWVWHMSNVPGLPVSFAPTFTERMTFKPQERIEYDHAPQGGREPAAVKGWYALEDHEKGTYLEIYLEICVALPLPKAADRVVSAAMSKVMKIMGDRFAKAFTAELGAEEIPVKGR